MRIHPRNWLLLALLAVLIGARVALDRPERTLASAGVLVEGFAPSRVTRIRVEAPGARAVTLERSDGGWSVVERFGHPAEASAVDRLLASVAGLSLADRVAVEAGTHGRFGVDESGTRIAFADAAGRALAELVQGAPASVQGGSYVRREAAPDVVRAARLEPVPAEPRSWLDTRLVEFDPAAATQVSLHHEGGRVFLDLMRDPEGGWIDLARPGTPAVSRLAVERLLAVASTLYFADVAGTDLRPEDGFGSPPETLVEVEVGEGELVGFWIGAPTNDGFYLATNPHRERSWIVRLPAASARVLFEAIDAVAGR